MENYFSIEFKCMKLSEFTEIVARFKDVTDVPFTVSMITRGITQDD